MAFESQAFALRALFEPCPDLRIPEEESEANRFMSSTIQLLRRLTEAKIQKIWTPPPASQDIRKMMFTVYCPVFRAFDFGWGGTSAKWWRRCPKVSSNPPKPRLSALAQNSFQQRIPSATSQNSYGAKSLKFQLCSANSCNSQDLDFGASLPRGTTSTPPPRIGAKKACESH